MRTSEFYDFFKKFNSVEEYFDGAYPIDLVPKTLEINHFIVVNTEYEKMKKYIS